MSVIPVAALAVAHASPEPDVLTDAAPRADAPPLPAVADPYTDEPSVLAAPPAPLPPEPSKAERLVADLARAEGDQAAAAAALGAAHAKLAAEKDAQSKYRERAAAYAIAAAEANERFAASGDVDAAEKAFTQGRKASEYQAAFEQRVQAFQAARIDPAQAEVEKAEDAHDRAALTVCRAQLALLDAEVLDRAVQARTLIGDALDRLKAKAREASALAHNIEFKRRGEVPLHGVDVSTPVLNVAEGVAPSNSNSLQRAGSVLYWAEIIEPQQEFEKAESRRRAEAPIPTAPLPQGARHPVFGVVEGPTGGIRNVSVGRVIVAD